MLIDIRNNVLRTFSTGKLYKRNEIKELLGKIYESAKIKDKPQWKHLTWYGLELREKTIKGERWIEIVKK